MRKKIIGAILIIGFSIILLTGCNKNPNITSESDLNIFVYVDPDTGANYVIYSHGYGAGICPRYNTDGSIMVTKDK